MYYFPQSKELPADMINWGPSGFYYCYKRACSRWLPYLLYWFPCVGVESPSHAIRADADPLARSATSVVITLADKYTYDCPVEILIYPSGRYTGSTLAHSMAPQLVLPFF